MGIGLALRTYSHAEPVVVYVREPNVPADVDSVEDLRVGFVLAVPTNLHGAKGVTSTMTERTGESMAKGVKRGGRGCRSINK